MKHPEAEKAYKQGEDVKLECEADAKAKPR